MKQNQGQPLKSQKCWYLFKPSPPKPCGQSQWEGCLAGSRMLWELAHLAKPGPGHSPCTWPSINWSLSFLISEMGILLISEVTSLCIWTQCPMNTSLENGLDSAQAGLRRKSIYGPRRGWVRTQPGAAWNSTESLPRALAPTQSTLPFFPEPWHQPRAPYPSLQSPGLSPEHPTISSTYPTTIIMGGLLSNTVLLF